MINLFHHGLGLGLSIYKNRGSFSVVLGLYRPTRALEFVVEWNTRKLTVKPCFWHIR